MLTTYAAMLTISGWALWTRRATWHIRWERYASLAILLSALGLLCQDLACQILMLSSLACALAHALIRSNLRDKAVPLVGYPMIVYASLMVTLFVLSEPGPRWAVHFIFLAYLLGLFAWAMTAFWRDGRSHPTVLACAAVIATAALSALAYILMWMQVIQLDWAKVSACIAVSIFSAAFAISWRNKMRPYDKQMKSVSVRI